MVNKRDFILHGSCFFAKYSINSIFRLIASILQDDKKMRKSQSEEPVTQQKARRKRSTKQYVNIEHYQKN